MTTTEPETLAHWPSLDDPFFSEPFKSRIRGLLMIFREAIREANHFIRYGDK